MLLYIIDFLNVFLADFGLPSPFPVPAMVSGTKPHSFVAGSYQHRIGEHPDFNDDYSFVSCYYGANPEKGVVKDADPDLSSDKLDFLSLKVVVSAVKLIPKSDKPDKSFFGKQFFSGVYVPYPGEKIMVEPTFAIILPGDYEVSTIFYF